MTNIEFAEMLHKLAVIYEANENLDRPTLNLWAWNKKALLKIVSNLIASGDALG